MDFTYWTNPSSADSASPSVLKKAWNQTPRITEQQEEDLKTRKATVW